MKNIWAESYQSGVATEINPDRYSSVVDLFEQSCAKYKDNPAFINFGTSITYGDLDSLSRNFAAYLQQELGLKKGERFAIMLPNMLQFPVAVFAALRAGLIVVNINPLYTADEFTHQINDADCETIIVLDSFANTVAEAAPRTKLKNIIVTQMGDLFGSIKGSLANFAMKYIKKMVPDYSIDNVLSFKNALNKGKSLGLDPVSVGHDDIAFLQYTGGTTGVAKGAELTHRNLISNVEQVTEWVQGAVKEHTEVIITPLPLYHILSLTANILLFLKFGARNVLITNPRDTADFIKQLSKYKFTGMIGVNTLFNTLLNSKDFHKLDFSNLRLSLGGGMAIHKSVADKWKEVTGCTLLEGYGLTETSPVVSITPMSISEYTGSIGLPVPSTEISIRDENGNEVAIGEAGELCVRGPQVMAGYWRKPDETKNVLSADGWLRTGDLVTMDDKGYMRIVDRIKDMILVSGFNVYPNEVESVIAAHPGVLEVGVIGIADENSGEVVQAFIVKKDPNLTEKQVIDHCREHLTSYKVPKRIKFTNELPKTTVGKIMRKDLRDAS